MSTHQNTSGAGSGHANKTGNPTLVEVTSQLAETPGDNDDPSRPAPLVKPQVVFVGEENSRTQRIVEITVERKKIDSAANHEPVQESPNEDAAWYVTPVVELDDVDEAATTTESKFAVDPFIYEIDGPIPVMPTLPVVEAETTTDKVLERENSGEHFAWRLLPGPYPAEGNVSQLSEEQVEPTPVHVPELPVQPFCWEDMELVAEGDSYDHGDCFFAQAGDVISIDGNQGFDHIDLRSYSIDNATFQPGAIVLHSDLSHEDVDESGQPVAPITIRHRGVQFAIFSGEIRVDL